ncbi:MAG: YebC/PmpR family DNA-binding transcriptional regulator [Bacilli bacterium]|nr:YebC/PmpR family DNA-binding transcriptional regulator [Bacilli bacterium]
MGRAHEVRAKSMAATAAKRSALFMRASKEIYMAAKSGVPDPNANLALRSAIEKWKSQQVTKDVIERAIQKAKGGSGEHYEAGRYEFFGPGGSLFIVDTLTDNVNRALTDVRTVFTKRGGRMGAVSYNFTEQGVLVFKGTGKDKIEEALILGDVDVREVSEDNGMIEVLVNPTFLSKAKEVLKGLNITEFDISAIQMIANELIQVTDPEAKDKINQILDALDEVTDVQEVYHNVEL